MLTLWFVTDWINEGFHSFLLLIDAVVYWFVSVCYNLFVFLATEPIFKEEFFTDFARRIYAILGVFMLFYLAYALLNALVDPEKLSKGDKSVSKLAMNLVISLILLGLSPTIFNYAYRLQNYILSSNLIGAIVMGSELEETNSITSFGDELSFTVMNTFINPENNNAYMGDNEYWSDYEESVKGKKHDYMGLPGLSKCVTKGCVIKSDDGSEGSNKEVITYYPFVSTGAGIFLIYIILSFTLDLGVRVFKFAFCQLLAPIPIVMRAMPGKKAQFDKWLKLTITVYLEVFVRVGCMYLAVYFIQALRKNITFAELFDGSKIMGMIALVILIMGVFSFAKQAPKMLSEMLGFDSGNIKLGFGDKLKSSGFLGAAIGGFGGSLLGGATGAIGGAVGSVFNGAGLAGAKYGMMNGWKNKGVQFNRQRESYYKDVIGGPGRAGWFGGQAFVDKHVDSYRNASKDAHYESANKYIKNFEASDKYKNIFNDKKLAATAKYNSAKAKYEADISQYQTANSQRLADLRTTQAQEIESKRNEALQPYLNERRMKEQEFERNKQAEINRLNNMRLETIDRAQRDSIQSQIDSLNSQVFADAELDSKINSIQNQSFSTSVDSDISSILNYKNEELEKAMDDAEALMSDEAVRKGVIKDVGGRYKEMTDYVKKYDDEKELKAYKSTMAFKKQKEVQAAAFKEAQEPGKSNTGGPKTGGK